MKTNTTFTVIAAILHLITFSNIEAFQCSQQLKGCDFCTNATYISAHHQLIFDSINIVNNSLEIEFDIKVNKYCYSCTIMQIDDLISLSMNSIYNIFQISVNNINVKNIPNANILLPLDNKFHHIYLSNSLLSNTSMYNQNIFKIDNLERYYSGSISPKTDSYQVYVGDAALQTDNSLDATMKNICINSSIKTADNIFKGELRCGDMLYGELAWSGQVYYYYFELTHTSNVIFDSCGSSYGAYIDFHTIGYDKMSAVWEDNCYPGAQALLPSLPKGRYIIEMGADGDVKDRGNDYRAWQLKVSCSMNRNYNGYYDQDAYYVLPEVILPNTEWFEAERKCENLHGTTLATIITNDDLLKAYEVINDNLDTSVNVSVWIGLAQTDVDGLNWQWIDGTSCDYTTSGDCIDDAHWHRNQPDSKPVTNSSHIRRSGAVLFITKHTNHSNLPTFIDLHMDYDPSGDLFFLCNGPGSKYNIKNCSDDNCWQYDSWRHQFSDYNIESDITGQFNPFIGHWNSTLFIIGNSEIHYTPMQPFNDKYVWHQKPYSNITYWNNAQLFAQHTSAVYIYGTQFNSESMYNHAVLLRMDLKTLQSTQENVDFVESIPLITKCIVASEHKVYFVQQSRMLIYHTDTKELWTGSRYGGVHLPAFTEQTTTTSCVMTEDEEFIYVFAMSKVSDTYHMMFTTLKYEIDSGKIIDLQTSDKCLTRNGFVTAVAARNGNIYLHGCNFAAWKTMIFDTDNDKFKNTTVAIGRPSKSDVPYYRSSKMVAVDNNILYLYAKTENGFDSYFTVTNLVSIDFGDTENEAAVWPSDGFDIKYYMNIFSSWTQDYHVLFYSSDTQNGINESITFNTQKDDCICSESIYQCFGCEQHFNLESHLTLQDNDVDELIFTTIYDDPDEYSKALITPNTFTIPLQRCVISITKPWETKSNQGHSIISRFNLSSNCHMRHGINFSLNITAESVLKELIITIVSDNKTICKVCDFQSSCVECDGNQFTIIPHLDDIKDTNFEFNFLSNMLDVKVLSPSDDNILHWRDPQIHWQTKYLYYGFFLLIVPIFIIYFCRRQYMNAFIVNKALVLIIPIERFDDEKMFLPGIRPAMANLENLWSKTYNYDVFTCNKIKGNARKQDVIDFIDENLKRLNHTVYKAIMVHIMSHGEGSTFKTSDLKDLDIDFIKHELTNAAEELEDGHGDFIKLIWNHVCQGENNYSIGGNSLLEIVRHDQIDEQYKYQDSTIPTNPPVFNNNHSEDMSPDSNVVVIAGNEPGRTMSDSGMFTECICKSFRKNLQRMVKRDFNTLYVEIGINLEKMTKKAELVHRSGNLRYTQIRFEKTKENKFYHESELSRLHRHNKSNSFSQYEKPLLDNTD